MSEFFYYVVWLQNFLLRAPKESKVVELYHTVVIIFAVFKINATNGVLHLFVGHFERKFHFELVA